MMSSYDAYVEKKRTEPGYSLDTSIIMDIDGVKNKIDATLNVRFNTYNVIKSDVSSSTGSAFKYLSDNLPERVDEVLAILKDACDINDGFYFENGEKYQDLNHIYDEIKAEVSKIKDEVNELSTAYSKCIQNVNKELDFNFSPWFFYYVDQKAYTPLDSSK